MINEDLQVRKYQPEDHDDVVGLHKRALAPTGAYLEGGSWDDDLTDIDKSYASGVFLVGEVNSKIVAMGALRPHSNPGVYEIKRMRVDPEYQRQGFGQAILSSLEQYAHSLGARELVLDTSSLQEPAQRFYEKNGYIKISTVEKHGLVTLFYNKKLDV